ncbi:OLC1v1013143C1 [Oldenlandia corymbosa var. corymbosa]|uniref:OLC1v1013143C1 n=1 Tax=Oldenlandia corymbosa var. corymbosa TaxID=529605 RepID=A0AAV1DXV1_OLDCO|nr:OLC1v1013143C1 [Oldenlandia corymbosa var. corymbosa]
MAPQKNTTTNVDSRLDGGEEKANWEDPEGKGEKRSSGKAVRVQHEEELDRLVPVIEASTSTKKLKDLGKENLSTPEKGLGDLNAVRTAFV